MELVFVSSKVNALLYKRTVIVSRPVPVSVAVTLMGRLVLLWLVSFASVGETNCVVGGVTSTEITSKYQAYTVHGVFAPPPILVTLNSADRFSMLAGLVQLADTHDAVVPVPTVVVSTTVLLFSKLMMKN